MKRTPKTNGKASTDTKDGIQMSYIAKSIAYDHDYGVCLYVGRKTDELTPIDFGYVLALDIDRTQRVMMTFQKRGRDIIGMDFLLNPEYPEPMVLLSNIVTFPNSTDIINMFQEHIKCDTTVFSYTAMDGQKKDFRFSLAGLNEKYLEQFV